MSQPYDLIIIGAGPGGYVGAIRAAQLGLRVACIEKEKPLGGTCLRVGCIPSKALLDSSHLAARLREDAAAHGITTGEITIDLATMMKRKDKVVQVLTGGIRGLFRKNGVERIEGVARIVGPGRVAVAGADGEQQLESRHILIATGSAPVELPVLPFDGKRIVSSTEALAFDRVPGRLIVIGAGAIGLELGSVWSRLGAEVLIVEALDRIAAGMDAECAAELEKALRGQGIEIVTGARVTGGRTTTRSVHVEIETSDGARTEKADRVLVAIGRRPFTEGLGLGEVGIETDERGFIRVDAQGQTTVPGIWAVGDVVGGPMLAHKASEEAIACVERLAGETALFDVTRVPAVIYTDPEFAAVGLTEEAARAQGIDIRIGRFPWMANGRARAAGETAGLVKMVVDEATDRVLGVHIVGAHAAELIAEGTCALEFEATAEDIALICHAHPTLAEAVKEAALDALGRVIHR